jgi:hypothetical protein
MSRRLLIFTVGLVLSTTLKPILSTAQQRDAQQNDAQSKSNQSQAQPNKTQTQSRAQIAGSTGSVQSIAEQRKPEANAYEPLKFWQWARTSSPTDVLTVLITGVLAFLAWRTLNAIKHQTDATAKSAEAAKTSAETLKFLERGDVVLNSVDFVSHSLNLDEQSIEFVIKNCGRTRATEASIAIAIHCSPKEPTAVHWRGYEKAAVLVPDETLTLITDYIKQWIGPFEAVKTGLVDIRFDGAVMFTTVFGDHITIIVRGNYDVPQSRFTFSQEPWRKT